MARAGLRKVRAYSLEFKVTAVRLSQQPGVGRLDAALKEARMPTFLDRRDIRDATAGAVAAAHQED